MRISYALSAVLFVALLLRLWSLSLAEPVATLQPTRLVSAAPPGPSPPPPLRLAPLRASRPSSQPVSSSTSPRDVRPELQTAGACGDPAYVVGGGWRVVHTARSPSTDEALRAWRTGEARPMPLRGDVRLTPLRSTSAGGPANVEFCRFRLQIRAVHLSLTRKPYPNTRPLPLPLPPIPSPTSDVLTPISYSYFLTLHVE